MQQEASRKLEPSLEQLLEQQLDRVAGSLEGVSLTEEQSQQLHRVLIGSDYVRDQIVRHPELLSETLSSAADPYRAGQMAERVRAALEGIESEEALMHALRRLRQREMLRIIWRDLNRLADLQETTRALSDLADACCDQALQWLHEDLKRDFGTPVDDEGVEQRLVVIGMGKHGAQELNLSSDIDLIFSFAEHGETQGGRRSLENAEFFNRLGKRLIKVLDTQTADGFVFRVDMRLRPFGASGPLVASFGAMEHYYQTQGRDWERYALIKARIVAGDMEGGEELLKTLTPFIYRRYIDYSAFESLRDMKQMISRENRIKGRHNNIKLGAGGIREVEFIAQAFQLIRGGRDRQLQHRELMSILPLLPEAVGVPEALVTELREAYVLLRNVEHAIQALADKQTQELPTDELSLERIAWNLGGLSWSDLEQQLIRARESVSRHFADVISPAEEYGADETIETDRELAQLWDQGFEDVDALQAHLGGVGFADVERASKTLIEFRNLRTAQVLQSIGQERLLALLPRLLNELVNCPQPEQTLERVLQLIQAVLRRSAYLVLLSENPGALKQLVRLCSASPWFAEKLANQPVLLDELIDSQALFNPPAAAELGIELRQHLLRIPEDDIEQLMEALRYFRNAHILRVAAADITGALPLMKVSDYLTWLAEAILQAVLEIAWREMQSKYGTPQRAQGEAAELDFVVVGYGKLGGIELSYGSDLDLVFLHDLPGDLFTAGGPREIANTVFFTRLGQRIIHILNTFTPSGQLYEVDMRLRPSGNSGLLVTSLEAFRQYQLKEAWTWEHQALVRARTVAGSARLAEAFMAVRGEILGQNRDPAVLRQEVIDMREKMRKHLGSGETTEGVDLKQDAGGIVDIEFSVQYLVLRYAAESTGLYEFTDNIRILDALESSGYLSERSAEALREGYKTYRSIGHRQSLEEKKGLVSEAEIAEMRRVVTGIWGEIFAS